MDMEVTAMAAEEPRMCRFAYSLIVVLLLMPALSEAADVNYEFRAGVIYSDNIRRTDVGTEDQTIAILGFSIDMSGESKRFEGSLAVDLEYLDYLDDVFDQELLPEVDAMALFKLAPDIFEWVFNYKLGVINRDPFGVDTAINRENINVFSTGPKLSLKLGSRTSIDLEGRYRDTSFEISNSDNSTVGGRLSLVRALTPKRSLSANVSADRIEFDDIDLYGAFDRLSAYIGFSSRVSRGDISIQLGINELHDAGETFSGTLASIAWNRRISEISTVAFRYDRRFSDAGNFFKDFDNIGEQPGSPGGTIPIADPFENRSTSISYNYERNRTNLSVSAYFSEDQYQTATQFDSINTGGSLNVSRHFGSGWVAQLGLSFGRRNFDNADREDDYRLATVGLAKQITRTLTLNLTYNRNERASNIALAEYVENRVSLTISYAN